jgi:hypothetical protein
MNISLIGYRTTITMGVSLLGSLGVLEQLGTNVADVDALVEPVLKFLDLGISIGFGVYAILLNHKNHEEMKDAGIR